jgi:hypothetical protein
MACRGVFFSISSATAETPRGVAFRERYANVVPHDDAREHGDEDREDTLAYFGEVRDFYQRAAREGRAVIFTVSQ